MSNNVKSIVRWINESESLEAILAEYGTVENYAIVRWFVPAAVAAQVHEHFRTS